MLTHLTKSEHFSSLSLKQDHRNLDFNVQQFALKYSDLQLFGFHSGKHWSEISQ